MNARFTVVQGVLLPPSGRLFYYEQPLLDVRAGWNRLGGRFRADQGQAESFAVEAETPSRCDTRLNTDEDDGERFNNVTFPRKRD